jgi:hypothetical protein
MVLVSTQPLTEMSTRNLSEGKGRPTRKGLHDCTTAQVVRCRLLPAEAQFISTVVHVGFIVERVALRQVIL